MRLARRVEPAPNGLMLLLLLLTIQAPLLPLLPPLPPIPIQDVVVPLPSAERSFPCCAPILPIWFSFSFRRPPGNSTSTLFQTSVFSLFLSNFSSSLVHTQQTHKSSRARRKRSILYYSYPRIQWEKEYCVKLKWKNVAETRQEISCFTSRIEIWLEKTRFYSRNPYSLCVFGKGSSSCNFALIFTEILRFSIFPDHPNSKPTKKGERVFPDSLLFFSSHFSITFHFYFTFFHFPL